MVFARSRHVPPGTCCPRAPAAPRWPGIAVGAFTANITLGPSIGAVLAITAGNTLAPLVAYLLARRAGFRRSMDRLSDVLALVFLGALGAMLVSATVGTAVLVLSGARDAGAFWPTWSVWWTGDAMGVLVVSPFLLVEYAALERRARPSLGFGLAGTRWAEASALAAVTLGLGYLATAATPSSLLFLVSPPLIWAALRFRLPGAAPCALAASTPAIIAASRRTGPFAHHGLLSNMVTLQAFNGVTALTALLLSAVIAERDRTHEEIRRVCAELQELVAGGRNGEG